MRLGAGQAAVDDLLRRMGCESQQHVGIDGSANRAARRLLKRAIRLNSEWINRLRQWRSGPRNGEVIAEDELAIARDKGLRGRETDRKRYRRTGNG